MSSIPTYDTSGFRNRFMPLPEIDALLHPDPAQFFIVRIEDMFPHVRLPVPPVRSLSHSCLFVTSGEAIMQIGGDRYSAAAGQLLFVPAGQVFSFGTPDVNTGYLLHFHPDILSVRFGASAGDFPFLGPGDNLLIRPEEPAWIEPLLVRLLDLYTRTGLQSLSLIRSYLMTFLYEAARYRDQEESLFPPTAAQLLTRRFKALLHKHIREEHRVSAYAGKLNVTPNHLQKAVREASGESPTKWIDRTLLVEAKVLLYQTSLPVSEIAAEIGFSDPSYFTRMFRKYEGVTPLVFRKKMEKS
jgi:AraC family transcriptional activator of pobA